MGKWNIKNKMCRERRVTERRYRSNCKHENRERRKERKRETEMNQSADKGNTNTAHVATSRVLAQNNTV